MPIPAYADKFKAQLSMGEIELIEALTRDEMARYGYEPMIAADRPVPPELWAEAAQRSAAGREAAWRELERADMRDFVLRRHRADSLDAVRRRLTEVA